jgi:glucosamine 6-phosphate synthetase-like amidotransferase/phosphosugar isomerase protein
MNRGTDAAGFAYIDENGFVQKYKQEGTFVELLRTESWMNLSMPKILIGHTRAATQGSPKRNENNHPLTAGNYTVVHNGIVVNDDYLTLKHNLERNAEVDSEVIPSLLAKIDAENEDYDNINVLEDGLSMIAGSHACAMLDSREPDSMYLWRNHSPLNIVYVPDLDSIMFSSSAYPLSATLDGYEVVTGEIREETFVIVDISNDLDLKEFRFESEKQGWTHWRGKTKGLQKDLSIYGLQKDLGEYETV